MKKSLMFVLSVFVALLTAILLAVLFGLVGHGVISILDSLLVGGSVTTLDIALILGYVIFGLMFEYLSYPKGKVQDFKTIFIWPFFLYFLIEEGLEKALKQM